jgi:hypothetical protein
MDLIAYINSQEPVKSWTATKKKAMLDDLCATHGYQETVTDEKGETVANPESKKDFANRMLVEQIKRWVNGWRKTQAEKEVTYEQIKL